MNPGLQLSENITFVILPGMDPSVRNRASRYLGPLDGTTPLRSPLKDTNYHNSNLSPTKRGKQDSSDLEDLARQLNIYTPSRNYDPFKSKYDSPSAIVSSFKTTPTSKSSSKSGEDDPRQTSNEGLVINGRNNSLADSKGYEYLCRIQAIKNWLEVVLGEQIPQSPVALITHIQNGIYLAKLANRFLPSKKPVYTQDSKLEFRHTENINRFFKLLAYLEIPDLFHFELTDLYDAKDVPKVWFCLHAISYKINTLNSSFPPMENLVGSLQFSTVDIKAANRALAGHQLPNFSSADNEDISSPGRNSYMNKTLSFASPNKSPNKSPMTSASRSPTTLLSFSSTSRSSETDNPFLEKRSRPELSDHGESFQLKTARTPDLSLKDQWPIFKDTENNTFSTKTFSRGLSVSENDMNIIKLQALCRGAQLRYIMFVKKIMLRSYDTELTHFFSIIRGNLVRKRTVHRHRDDLLLFQREIIELQSLARKKISQQLTCHTFDSVQTASVHELQNVLRGSSVRKLFQRKLFDLHKCEEQLTEFQSIIRSKTMRYRVSTVLQYQHVYSSKFVEFQSIIRRHLYMKKRDREITSRLVDNEAIIDLQAIIRGGQARNSVRKCLRVLMKQQWRLQELQNIARGAILRTRLCNNVLITLIGEDLKMNKLFAKARGNSVRQLIRAKKSVLMHSEPKIIALQSAFRGILLRFNNSDDLEDIYMNVDSIIRLQAAIRTNKVLKSISVMKAHYLDNIDKVVRAQAILKSKYTRNAYKSFVNMKNPPVGIVRKFANLLSDSGIDFQEELELTDLKDKILEKSKNNEDLELQIENLDIKLSLLDKNKISIEDFMKHNNKFKTYKPITHSAANSRSLEKLNKSSKKRIELYSSMLYFLQTQPCYWMKMYHKLDPHDKNQQVRNLQYHISQLFSLSRGSANSHSREEFFYVKFMCTLMAKDISQHSRNIADITKLKNTFWIDFLTELNNQAYHRAYLKKLLGKPVEAVIDNDDITFEPDPSRIYDQIRLQEINIHGVSNKDENVSPQIAIKDAHVSNTFIRNLTALRDATSDIVESIRCNVSRLPTHMRVLTREAYKLSQIHYPEQGEQLHLSVAGAILIKHYVASLMLYPENFGYSTQDPITSNGTNPTKIADNLKYLSRVLLQVFSMKPFSDNFMKPLNEFVLSHTGIINAIIKDVIKVEPIEIEYEMNDYDDLVAHERPQLTMKVSDMIAIEKLISRNLDSVVPSLDDQLYSIISELNELLNSADDYVTLTELGNLTLTLSPTTKEDSMVDSKVRSLFAQVKRCIVYIIRVQEGDDLLEIFVRGIQKVHEDRFREIIATENQDESQSSRTLMFRNPYQKSPLGDLTNMSYLDLKKMALKFILQLEHMGFVSRKNSYQEILNRIVIDIKTKDTQRYSRKTQLSIARQTVKKLMEKEIFLKRQLDDYNQHIDKVLNDMQRRPKDKKIFNIIPVFSKQYFYHRQLKKNNRLPKFGSYKFSAKKLMEQDIVKDIGGAFFSKSASASKVEFMFSCHKVGEFVIEAACGAVTIPGACNTITLDQLLDHQYEKKKQLMMFDGMVTFDTSNFSSLIFKNFYDIRKE